MQPESIRRNYCDWETFAEPLSDTADCLFLRGDLFGDLETDSSGKHAVGFFELPARGRETNLG